VAQKTFNTKLTKRSVSAPESVDAFVASLDHPYKEEIIALRKVILGADATIAESIKWNAPSFSTSEYFATFHLRAKDGVQIILHLGAKVRDNTKPDVLIDDPESLLEWLGKDRALVKFRDLDDIGARQVAFVNVIRQWLTYL
jgi:hypothetical protein